MQRVSECMSVWRIGQSRTAAMPKAETVCGLRLHLLFVCKVLALYLGSWALCLHLPTHIARNADKERIRSAITNAMQQSFGKLPSPVSVILYSNRMYDLLTDCIIQRHISSKHNEYQIRVVHSPCCDDWWMSNFKCFTWFLWCHVMDAKREPTQKNGWKIAVCCGLIATSDRSYNLCAEHTKKREIKCSTNCMLHSISSFGILCSGNRFWFLSSAHSAIRVSLVCKCAKCGDANRPQSAKSTKVFAFQIDRGN